MVKAINRLFKMQIDAEVAKQLPMDSRSEDYSGGDALGGNTRTHPEHDG